MHGSRRYLVSDTAGAGGRVDSCALRRISLLRRCGAGGTLMGVHSKGVMAVSFVANIRRNVEVEVFSAAAPPLVLTPGSLAATLEDCLPRFRSRVPHW